MPQSEWPKTAAGYETICELGKSAHGSTWKASCTENGRVVSIKRLNFDAQANLSFELFDAIRKEVSLSMTFSHKCIQTVHAAFVNDSELWVVVDYMDKVCVFLHCVVAHPCISECFFFTSPPSCFSFHLRRAPLPMSSSSSSALAKSSMSALCSTSHRSCSAPCKPPACPLAPIFLMPCACSISARMASSTVEFAPRAFSFQETAACSSPIFVCLVLSSSPIASLASRR